MVAPKLTKPYCWPSTKHVGRDYPLTDAAIRRAFVIGAAVLAGVGFSTVVVSLVTSLLTGMYPPWPLLLVLTSLTSSLLRFVVAFTLPRRKNLAEIVTDIASAVRRPNTRA